MYPLVVLPSDAYCPFGAEGLLSREGPIFRECAGNVPLAVVFAFVRAFFGLL